MNTGQRMDRPRGGWAALWLSLLFIGCGVEDIGRMTLEADIPVVVRLPVNDLPASPIALTLPVPAEVPLDLVASLRETGRTSEADILTDNQDKILGVELVAVEYEVESPNRLPASLSAVTVAVGPFEGTREEAVTLGTTVAIPARRAIATRELAYTAEGRALVEPTLFSLKLSLFADTTLSAPAGEAVKAQAMVLRLRLKLTIDVDLTR